MSTKIYSVHVIIRETEGVIFITLLDTLFFVSRLTNLTVQIGVLILITNLLMYRNLTKVKKSDKFYISTNKMEPNFSCEVR